MTGNAKSFELKALLLAIAQLKEISSGSDHSGRWLDSDDTECSEDDEGAKWEDFTLEEQNGWIDSVSDQCQSLLMQIAEMAREAGEGVPAEVLSALIAEDETQEYFSEVETPRG